MLRSVKVRESNIGSFCLSTIDHFDRVMIEANLRAFEPSLLSHGYAASDIAALTRDCAEEVSLISRKEASVTEPGRPTFL